MPLHCALGLSQGAPVVAELCPASLRRIRHYAKTSSATTADTDTQTNAQPASPSHRQSWSRVPVCPFTFVYLFLDELHDLIFALESPFAAEGRSCPFFFRYNDNSFTDPCLCITARDQQHLAQASIQTQLTSLAPDSSRLSAAQTGFTAQPCIHAERQLIASSFTVGDDIKLHPQPLIDPLFQHIRQCPIGRDVHESQ